MYFPFGLSIRNFEVIDVSGNYVTTNTVFNLQPRVGSSEVIVVRYCSKLQF